MMNSLPDPGIGRDQNSEENLYENQAYLEPDNLEISRQNREKGKRLSPDHHQSNNNAIYANDSVVSSSTTFLRLLEIASHFKTDLLLFFYISQNQRCRNRYNIRGVITKKCRWGKANGWA